MKTSTILGIVVVGVVGAYAASASSSSSTSTKPSKPPLGGGGVKKTANPLGPQSTPLTLDPILQYLPSATGRPQETWDQLRARIIHQAAPDADSQPLVAQQYDAGFVAPGNQCGEAMGYDWEDYRKSLGEFGYDQIWQINPEARASLLDLGHQTLLVARGGLGGVPPASDGDPYVLAAAKKIADSCLGEIGSSTFSNVPQRDALVLNTDPAALAGAVARARSPKSKLSYPQAMALGVAAQQRFWAQNSGLPGNGHLYALAAAWDAVKGI